MKKNIFEPVPSPFNFAAAEHDVIRFWKEHKVYHQSLEQRRDAEPFVFYEGPPTANGMPHPGHCLTRTIKDIFPRYKTMQGYYCERKAGWDTHGLPVEIEVCKELGIIDGGKAAIEAFGVEQFNRRCIESVFRYQREWEELTDRIGFWVDLEDAYVTYHQSYVESVWWALKQLFDRGLLYQCHKVVWWWAQGGTALSAGEVGEGYRDTDDPAITVRLALTDESRKRLGLDNIPVKPPSKTEPTRVTGAETKSRGDSNIPLNPPSKGDFGEPLSGEGHAQGVVPQLLSVSSSKTEPAEGGLSQDTHATQPEGVKVPLPKGDLGGCKRVSVAQNQEQQPLLASSSKGDLPASLLIWTTTPWTLPSNCACCVGPEVEYVTVRHKSEAGNDEYLILARQLLEKNLGEGVEVVKSFTGRELDGLTYQPLFPYDVPTRMDGPGTSEKHWLVLLGDFVDLETGTGIVHMAPAFGEDDYRLCREQGVGFLCFVKPDGTFDERVTDVDPFDQTPIAGQFCKDADKAIIRVLKERGAILKHEQYRHAYPFCPRAEDDPLIQYARKSWFIRTSDFIPDFLANNSQINWQPEHIRDGRFGKFLESNVDWALSRERYWGTPLPVWVCEKTGHMECVSSYGELLAKPDVQGLEVWQHAKRETPTLNENLKVHKPYIDAVTYQSPRDSSARMRRVPEVIDVWFDAGSMPFAQWGYPHVEGSKENFESRFPADFISEAIDQTRGWFYAQLAIATVVFGKEKVGWPIPFKNCICLGHILGEDGMKLSKRLKNYTDPKIVFEKFSADALRWSFISKNPPTSSSRMSDRIIEECQRELLMRWYNVYSFFVIYANLDGFDPVNAPAEFLEEASAGPTQILGAAQSGSAPFHPRAERAELDRWILEHLDQTAADMVAALDQYDSFTAARALSDFLDSLSNWYVRRSRARFWSSEWTADKANAYWTLYECLLKFARLAAPFVPFFSETTWRNLVGPLPGAAHSVHLTRYPKADPEKIDAQLLQNMALTREAVTLGLSARRAENIKVRQPLGLCEIVVSDAAQRTALEKHLDLIQEELNIKRVEFTHTPEAYVEYDVRPNFKLLGPRFGKKVQAIRAALAKGDGATFFRQLQEGALKIAVEGEVLELTSEEVEVRLQAREGFAAAQGRNMVVVISTEITEELRREGWVRELIRIVQDLRKDLGLAYDARIEVIVQTEDAALADVILEFRDMIAGEVLAASLSTGTVHGDGAKTASIDEKALTVLVRQV